MSGPPLPPWATRRDEGGVPAPDSPRDRRLATFIGPRWATYRRKFAPFFDDPRFQPTWNWSAAFGTAFGMPFWFFYRKLYFVGVLFMLLPNIAFSVLWNGAPPSVSPEGQLVIDPDAVLVLAGVMLSTFVVAGGTANWLLFRRAQAALRLVDMRGLDEAQARVWLQRIGQASWRAVAFAFLVIFALQRLAIAALSSGAVK